MINQNPYAKASQDDPYTIIEQLKAQLAEKDATLKDHGEIQASLCSQLTAAQVEILEQCRLNGMGAERESALASKLEAAEREIAALKNAVAVEREACAKLCEQEKNFEPIGAWCAHAIRARSGK